MLRKIHSTEPGYIAERHNPFVKGKKIVIYVAEKKGIDTSPFPRHIPYKYAIVCDAHGTVCGETSIPKARLFMKNPQWFCDECDKILYHILQEGRDDPTIPG